MTTPLFYREQASQQQAAADAATLQNVRDRCQGAADAWTTLAARSERVATIQAARVVEGGGGERAGGASDNPDRRLSET